VNHKKIQRLWRDEGLRVPQRRKRKRHGTSTAPPTVSADAPDRVWAVDFQFDVTTDGRPIKIVSIIDEHTRECLGGIVERSITGEHLIDELDRVASQRRTYPAILRCDNGPELACSAMADWASGQVGLHFIPPAQRLRRIVQLPHPRRMPQHQQLLVPGPRPRRHRRLEKRLQPPPALIAGLPTPSPLRCHLYPPMNNSRSP
jgi:transposase InsO family protein